MELSKLAKFILGIIALFIILTGFILYYGKLSEAFNNFLEPFGLGKKTETQNLPSRIDAGFTTTLDIYKKCLESSRTGCICQKETLPHLSTKDYILNVISKEGGASTFNLISLADSKIIKQESILMVTNCYITNEGNIISNGLTDKVISYQYPKNIYISPTSVEGKSSNVESILLQGTPSLYKLDKTHICFIRYRFPADNEFINSFKTKKVC